MFRPGWPRLEVQCRCSQSKSVSAGVSRMRLRHDDDWLCALHRLVSTLFWAASSTLTAWAYSNPTENITVLCERVKHKVKLLLISLNVQTDGLNPRVSVILWNENNFFIKIINKHYHLLLNYNYYFVKFVLRLYWFNLKSDSEACYSREKWNRKEVWLCLFLFFQF